MTRTPLAVLVLAISSALAGSLGLPGSALAQPQGGLGSSYCGPAELHSGSDSAQIAAIGSEVVAMNDFALVATNMPIFKLGLFLMSRDGAFVPMAGGSQGNLCLGGTITRLSQAVLNSGSTGSFALSLDLAALPVPAAQVLPGETWRFQAWFRDLNPANTSNFSDGLVVLFQ